MNTRVDVLEHTAPSGLRFYYERHESVLPVEAFDQAPIYKQHCEGCPRYGRNLACPPHSPLFSDYIKGFSEATVICIRIPLEYFSGLAGEARYRSGHRVARELLVRDLLAYREKGCLVLGSGACHACACCPAETGGTRCKKPRKRIYSLESLGVNVVALVKSAFDFELEWNADERYADYVSAVGAAFCAE